MAAPPARQLSRLECVKSTVSAVEPVNVSVPEVVPEVVASEAAPEVTPEQPEGQALMDSIKAELYEKKFRFLSSEEVVRVMKHLGATDAGMKRWGESFNDHADCNLVKDPNNDIKFWNSRLEVFRKEDDAETAEETWATRKLLPHESLVLASEEFRYMNDGLRFRPFGQMASWLLENDARSAMIKFCLEMEQIEKCQDRPGGINSGSEVREADGGINDEKDLVITCLMQQTRREPGATYATASPEGIHQDGGDVVLVLFNNTENLVRGGESRVYSPDVPRGDYSMEEQPEREKYLLTPPHVLSHQFEALVILDMEVAHEARGQFQALDPEKMACRNVATFHLRRPDVNNTDGMERAKAFENPATESDKYFDPEHFAAENEIYPFWKKLCKGQNEKTLSEGQRAIMEKINAASEKQDSKTLREMAKKLKELM